MESGPATDSIVAFLGSFPIRLVLPIGAFELKLPVVSTATATPTNLENSYLSESRVNLLRLVRIVSERVDDETKRNALLAALFLLRKVGAQKGNLKR
jgi:hypothetical protein